METSKFKPRVKHRHRDSAQMVQSTCGVSPMRKIPKTAYLGEFPSKVEESRSVTNPQQKYSQTTSPDVKYLKFQSTQIFKNQDRQPLKSQKALFMYKEPIPVSSTPGMLLASSPNMIKSKPKTSTRREKRKKPYLLAKSGDKGRMVKVAGKKTERSPVMKRFGKGSNRSSGESKHKSSIQNKKLKLQKYMNPHQPLRATFDLHEWRTNKQKHTKVEIDMLTNSKYKKASNKYQKMTSEFPKGLSAQRAGKIQHFQTKRHGIAMGAKEPIEEDGSRNEKHGILQSMNEVEGSPVCKLNKTPVDNLTFGLNEFCTNWDNNLSNGLPTSVKKMDIQYIAQSNPLTERSQNDDPIPTRQSQEGSKRQDGGIEVEELKSMGDEDGVDQSITTQDDGDDGQVERSMFYSPIGREPANGHMPKKFMSPLQSYERRIQFDKPPPVHQLQKSQSKLSLTQSKNLKTLCDGTLTDHQISPSMFMNNFSSPIQKNPFITQLDTPLMPTNESNPAFSLIQQEDAINKISKLNLSPYGIKPTIETCIMAGRLNTRTSKDDTCDIESEGGVEFLPQGPVQGREQVPNKDVSLDMSALQKYMESQIDNGNSPRNRVELYQVKYKGNQKESPRDGVNKFPMKYFNPLLKSDNQNPYEKSSQHLDVGVLGIKDKRNSISALNRCLIPSRSRSPPKRKSSAYVEQANPEKEVRPISQKLMKDMFSMDLKDRELKGLTLSQFLGHQKLQMLDIRSNKLDKIPIKVLDILPNLKNLRIDSNNLTNLPTNIGVLNKLEVLTCSQNKLKVIPSRISKLQNLICLHMNDNSIEQVPPKLSELTRLTVFHIHDNPITQLPSTLSQLCHLKELGIDWALYIIRTSEVEVVSKVLKHEETNLNVKIKYQVASLTLKVLSLRQIYVSHMDVMRQIEQSKLNTGESLFDEKQPISKSELNFDISFSEFFCVLHFIVDQVFPKERNGIYDVDNQKKVSHVLTGLVRQAVELVSEVKARPFMNRRVLEESFTSEDMEFEEALRQRIEDLLVKLKLIHRKQPEELSIEASPSEGTGPFMVESSRPEDQYKMTLNMGKCIDQIRHFPKGRSLIHYLYLYEHFHLINHLVNHKRDQFNVNIKDEEGTNPLQLSMGYKRFDAAREILQLSKTFKGKQKPELSTTLSHSFHKSFPKPPKQPKPRPTKYSNLIIDLTHKTPNYKNCFLNALEVQQFNLAYEMVELNQIGDKPTNLNVVDDDGCNGFHYLFTQYQSDPVLGKKIFNAMLSWVYDPWQELNYVNKSHMTPLHIACKYKQIDALKMIVKLEKEHEARGQCRLFNFQAKAYKEQTLFHIACLFPSEPMINYLIQLIEDNCVRTISDTQRTPQGICYIDIFAKTIEGKSGKDILSYNPPMAKKIQLAEMRIMKFKLHKVKQRNGIKGRYGMNRMKVTKSQRYAAQARLSQGRGQIQSMKVNIQSTGFEKKRYSVTQNSNHNEINSIQSVNASGQINLMTSQISSQSMNKYLSKHKDRNSFKGKYIIGFGTCTPNTMDLYTHTLLSIRNTDPISPECDITPMPRPSKPIGMREKSHTFKVKAELRPHINKFSPKKHRGSTLINYQTRSKPITDPFIVSQISINDDIEYLETPAKCDEEVKYDVRDLQEFSLNISEDEMKPSDMSVDQMNVTHSGKINFPKLNKKDTISKQKSTGNLHNMQNMNLALDIPSGHSLLKPTLNRIYQAVDDLYEAYQDGSKHKLLTRTELQCHKGPTTIDLVDYTYCLLTLHPDPLPTTLTNLFHHKYKQSQYKLSQVYTCRPSGMQVQDNNPMFEQQIYKMLQVEIEAHRQKRLVRLTKNICQIGPLQKRTIGPVQKILGDQF